jgi:plastocyanin
MTKTTWLKRHLALPLGLTAAVVLASCGQTDSPAAAPPATQGNATTSAATTSPASAAPSTSAGQRIDIRVTGKQITPAPATVKIAVGESLTVVVTSDHDDQLHAHGFGNLEKDVKAGKPLEVTVTGAQTGVFEFELHHPELLLFKVAVS